MTSRKLIFLLFLICFYAVRAIAVEPECLKWFERSKIKMSDKNCLITCSALGVDMGTFYCTDRCEDLCSVPPKTCNSEALLNKHLGSGSPQHWQNAKERAKPWSQSEKNVLKTVLSKMPLRLSSKDFRVYRMTVSSQHPKNPASTLGNSIVFYDEAFKGNIARILFHELGHIYFNDLQAEKVKDYAMAARWSQSIKTGEWVPGRLSDQYVEPDGSNSIEEDFANNIEYLVFDLEKLKKKTPSLSNWLSSTFGDSLKLGEGCQ